MCMFMSTFDYINTTVCVENNISSWIKKTCRSVFGQDTECLIAPIGDGSFLHGSSHPLVKSSGSTVHFKGVELVLLLLQAVFHVFFMLYR